MKMRFSCPSCGASGSVDESFVGKQIRCKQCTHRFAVPSPADPDTEGYALVEPSRGDARVAAARPDSGPVFVPSRGDEPSIVLSPRKPKRIKPRSTNRRSETGFAWKTWLIGVGLLAAITLLMIVLMDPNGLVHAGSAILILGTLMVLIGFAAGAYGAFCEDFLYGFFYLVFALYTAYYIVTRWEDLWKWCLCSTAGVGLVLIGTWMLGWVGVGD